MNRALPRRLDIARRVLTQAPVARHAGACVVIAGGSGFLGRWLLEGALEISRTVPLDIFCISRRPPEVPAADAYGFRHIASDVRLLDIRQMPRGARIIHAASPINQAGDSAFAETLASTIVSGTQQLLNAAISREADRFVYISSGAVYARRTPDPDEAAPTVSADATSAYARHKAEAELRCNAARSSGLSTVIARLFAFLGAGMPVNGPLAAGNFIRDAVAGEDIALSSSGCAIRSYQHPADTAVWLLSLLFQAQPPSLINVGDDAPISIRDLAERVGMLFGRRVVVPHSNSPSALIDRYVPDLSLARRYGLCNTISLNDAIQEAYDWMLTA